uniref:protein disulfide-isomerase n=1 Tax=Timema genevievae TaxID=629358 RepID=A0A7R9JNQ1_TIMGE|nr:unnamed protein product [Timema genevievae]
MPGGILWNEASFIYSSSGSGVRSVRVGLQAKLPRLLEQILMRIGRLPLVMSQSYCAAVRGKVCLSLNCGDSQLLFLSLLRQAGDKKDVIELTDSNFDSLVLNSEDMWLVEFYAPWCGHCKNLAPHWAKAASELKDKVKVGALDATVHTIKSNQYGVQGYPTIKVFTAGKKDSSSVTDYAGGRTASDIVTWALNKLAENVSPPEIKQIVSEDTLKEACEKHSLCVVSVLPHILDCQSTCRNDYLDILNKLGEKYKNKMWG